MRSPFTLSSRFLAASALAISSSMALPSAIANDNPEPLAKSAKAADNKRKTLIPIKLPPIDQDAPLQDKKFLALRKAILEESVRADLTPEKLNKAAKEGLISEVKKARVQEVLQKAISQGLAKRSVMYYARQELSLEALQEAISDKDAKPGIIEFVKKELAKLPAKTYTTKDYVEFALKGMFRSITPHDDYFNTKETSQMKEAMSSSFVGIGVNLDLTEGKIKVERPIPGGPAEKAGILKDDIITGADAISFDSITPEDAIEKHLRGEEGSSVRLKIQRGGTPIEISLVRAAIKQPGVEYTMLEDGIAHFHIKSFSSNISQELRDKVAEAKADASLDPALSARGGLRGIILNFMNDPGGSLDEARQMADDFIDKEGFIVTTEGRDISHNEIYKSDKGDILNGLPIVVLVNEGSASASEIVPNALQDHERAVVMGTPTFGKGTVQVFRSYPDGTASKITISQFVRPSGTSNQLVGTIPDILIDTKNADYEAYRKKARTERDLPNALPNERGFAEQKGRTKAVCSPVSPGVKVAEAEREKGLYHSDGMLNIFLACARDYILKQDNPGYAPSRTITVPYTAPGTPRPNS